MESGLNITDEDILTYTEAQLCSKYNLNKQILHHLILTFKHKTYSEYKKELQKENRKVNIPIHKRRTVTYDITENKIQFYGEWDNNSSIIKLEEIRQNLLARRVLIEREIDMIDSFIKNIIDIKIKEFSNVIK